MSPGRHAADDGSFGRSAGGAMLRGALLLAIAVILGVVLLNTFDDGKDPFAQSLVASGANATTTTAAAAPEVTTTTAASTPALRAPREPAAFSDRRDFFPDRPDNDAGCRTA